VPISTARLAGMAQRAQRGIAAAPSETLELLKDVALYKGTLAAIEEFAKESRDLTWITPTNLPDVLPALPLEDAHGEPANPR
jgi:hypothetical protein